jgi:hypothetical protein
LNTEKGYFFFCGAVENIRTPAKEKNPYLCPLKTTITMGRKAKERPSIDGLFSTAMTMLVPSHILENFEMWGAQESQERWVIEMREKSDRIPIELSDNDDIVFDGYCNPVEMLSHSFVCKPIYLRLYRRRYKRSGGDIHFSNHYELRLKGVKMVPELGFFLKDED